MNKADAACRTLIARFGARKTYLPLLVNYTHEDRAAKGLRTIADPSAARPPIHYSAVEVVAQDRAVLLLGPHGAGKTSFALDLALNLAGERIGDPAFNLARLERVLPRNDLGDVAPEAWSGKLPVPVYLRVTGPTTLAAVLEALPGAPTLGAGEPMLLILDGAEHLDASAAEMFAALGDLLARVPTLRVLVLGETGHCAGWSLPDVFATYSLLPLLETQRDAYRKAVAPAAEAMSARGGPALPELFLLSLDLVDPPETPYRLVDAWLLAALGSDNAVAQLAAQAFDNHRDAVPAPNDLSSLVSLHLVARHLETIGPSAILAMFASDPVRWAEPAGLTGRRLSDRATGDTGAATSLASLVDGLASLPDAAGGRGALVAAGVIETEGLPSWPGAWDTVVQALLAAIAGDRLPIPLRVAAGRHLAQAGDPRDLDLLISIPAAGFVMGSTTHPNSMPVHAAATAAFRVGRYPITNRAYAGFIAATGRPWRSADGPRAERANVPAVDLTWHDANAFCDWLTDRWRADGRIAMQERVRLPTEPEWEHAARCGQPDQDPLIVYPWEGGWHPSRANSSETGLNDTCAVGLFPAGRSLFGLDDMTGQVWEWTSTLWGPDMAHPAWAYPYRTDGRENPTADASIRRVLRGGCFSSGKAKACCTYRGSLEPDGFWRGNGFRIVVSA
ncbi:SUMF1/EgtB/PvdO family nonheme iron enzyme [Lichenicola cladoniae]|uniref:SUMF1/EgtB/PvdO family nonheme iron enzyme n=1 Tax=Lichenicola cladoniae TaxID=1484109 RepID=A0A6M8H5R5_9PROT|nr:SUMF1/EgtB/PvdO family nonheme iron enzyme [Lichenicola cladoniae]NPD65247.1 SUMF1/EgtB/PvdO family nonheme iron enzyme [Acetobacteraceae bacterium]QKE88841.1 SUMF1/EgtB/PvdO family nonheme iron enzyme [Lichenicola cladoniae]